MQVEPAFAYCRPCQQRVAIDNVREFSVERQHARKNASPVKTSMPWLTGTCPQCGRRVTAPARAALQPQET